MTYLDWLASVLIYLVALGITLQFALRHDFIKERSDRLDEYRVYEDILKGQNILKKKQHDDLVRSCLIVLLFPHLIHRITHWNPLTIFKIFPCFFYALMPTFTYLISRQFLDIPYSIIASAILLSNFFFLYYPDTGRVGAAQGFLAVMLYAVLTGHPVLASAFAVLVVLSHYGTAYLTLFAMLGACAISFLTDNGSLVLYITSIVLAISTIVWNCLIIKTSGKICFDLIKRSVTFADLAKEQPPWILSQLPSNVPHSTSKFSNFCRFEYRDPVIATAFGKTMKYMSIPQKIEFTISWLIVILLSAGFVLTIWQLGITTYTAMTCGMFAVILVALVLPSVSAWYGFIRVYFTTFIVLAPCFAIGVSRLPYGYILGSVIIILYALCVSGAMHKLFRIDKRQLQLRARCSLEGTG